MIEKRWWKERVFYQVYPRSFKDSNGDGIGDLRGIIEKLDYLKWLGIGAIWLNPIYDSPNDDMGYDIRDYEKIMTEFGTMADFDELLKEMHKRDIKLIMDLVINHTSDENAWFVESRKSRKNPFRNYYIWRDGKNGREPNNWESFFSHSAWKYDEKTEQWYLHLFSPKQVDLNWKNAEMRGKLYNMINWWFDKGVDGFRMDVINLIAKKPGLPDGTGKPDTEGYVMADENFANQPKLHTYLKEIRKNCFDGRDCFCVGETPFTDRQKGYDMVDPANHELDMIFRFELMDIDSGPSGKWDVVPWSLAQFKKIMNELLMEKGWASLFWSNHDQPRPIGRFADAGTEVMRVRSGKMLAALMYLRKGTPFIFQGDEIGMDNVPFRDVSDFRDIESLNIYHLAEKENRLKETWNGILLKSRDNARTPMQWDDSENAGFTSGTPWIMVNPHYEWINVEKARKDPDSILNYYRKLIELRRTNEALIYGDYQEVLHENEQIFAYKRILDDDEWLILCNMSRKDAEIPEVSGFENGQVVLSNLEQIQNEKILLPSEARIIHKA